MLKNYRNFLDVTTSSKRLAIADVAGEDSDVTGCLLFDFHGHSGLFE